MKLILRQNKCATLLIFLFCLPNIIQAANLKRSVLNSLSRIASSQVRQSQVALQEAQLGLAASLSLTSRVGPAYSSVQGQSASTFIYGDVGFIFQKPIIDGGTVRFQTEAAQLQLLSTQYQSRSVLERVAIDVVKAYLDVVFQHEIVRINSTYIAEYRKIEQITEARRNTGIATEADVLVVRARVIGAESGLNRARLSLSRAENVYNTLVGPIENDMVIPLVVDDIFFQNFELLVEKLRSKNSTLQQSKYQSRVALADLNVTRSEESIKVFGSVEGKYSDTTSQGAGRRVDLGAYLNVL